jgi:hypothetical protein
MATGSTLACIGTPISWLRLETFASGRADSAVGEHVAACPACKHCLEEIRADVVALPPLAMPAPRAPAKKRAWWTWAVPAFAMAAAAVIVIVVFRGREEAVPAREDVVAIKGVGDVVLGTVRERGGVIRDDARSFQPGDRWKLVVTCPPSSSGVLLAVDVTVVEIGGSTQIDRPLVPAEIACGNRVVLPGAFSLTGPRANRVCAALGVDKATACVTIAPE